MIHLKLDGQKVVGYEVGTRREFDERHSDAPDWFFLDRDYRSETFDLHDFFTNPSSYHIDNHQLLQKNTESKDDPYLVVLKDADGNTLTDSNGKALVENTRFTGNLYLIDRDGTLLIDADGVAVNEPRY